MILSNFTILQGFAHKHVIYENKFNLRSKGTGKYAKYTHPLTEEFASP